MKTKILNLQGKPTKEIALPSYFEEKIREDIAQKFFETYKIKQPYGPNPLSGKKHSASGKIKRQRHKWKTSYGYGIARTPRKVFWRRGTRFYWVGAFVAYTRGGRAAHAPKVEHFFKKLKINKKEILIALKTAFASTASSSFIGKRYSTIDPSKIQAPFIVEDKIISPKTKEFYESLKNIFGDLISFALQKKSVRAGKGKTRGRKYKQNAGLLLVIGEDQKTKLQGVDVRKVSEIKIDDLFPLGRLTLYTESAIKNLNEIKGEKNEKTNQKTK